MFLGFDTSNYTTSVAVFDGKRIVQKKKLLEVKQGERGLRQSDAVFQHTVNMPYLIDELVSEAECSGIDAVAVSTRPRNVDGSYMPCLVKIQPVQLLHFQMLPFSKPRIRLGIFWQLFFLWTGLN